jgi:putative ABC transport system substrate-binding protein
MLGHAGIWISARLGPCWTNSVGLQLDVIVADSTAAAAALQTETRTIPIVFANVSDPVASGIVARLDHPGGNITGFANYEATLPPEWSR